MEFYAVAAQVIPVLMLVMAAGSGRADAPIPSSHEAGRAIIHAYALVVAGLGEFAALGAVAFGTHNAVIDGTVVAGLIAGVLVGVLALVRRHVNRVRAWASRASHADGRPLGTLLFLLVCMSLSWIALWGA